MRFGLIGGGQHGRLLTRALGEVAGTTLVACADPNRAALDSFPGDVERFASAAERSLCRIDVGRCAI